MGGHTPRCRADSLLFEGHDSDRRHTVTAAAAEYDRLVTAYADLGYILIELPRVSVADRAEFVLATLAGSGPREAS